MIYVTTLEDYPGARRARRRCSSGQVLDSVSDRLQSVSSLRIANVTQAVFNRMRTAALTNDSVLHAGAELGGMRGTRREGTGNASRSPSPLRKDQWPDSIRFATEKKSSFVPDFAPMLRKMHSESGVCVLGSAARVACTSCVSSITIACVNDISSG